MKTKAQEVNEEANHLQKELVRLLRLRGEPNARDTWTLLLLGNRREKIEQYYLDTPQRQSHLTKVAFPDSNHKEVDAALESGSNLNDLYDLARGRASIAKDSKGKYKLGKKGHFKIVRT